MDLEPKKTQVVEHLHKSIDTDDNYFYEAAFVGLNQSFLLRSNNRKMKLHTFIAEAAHAYEWLKSKEDKYE